MGYLMGENGKRFVGSFSPSGATCLSRAIESLFQVPAGRHVYPKGKHKKNESTDEPLNNVEKTFSLN